MSYLHPLIGAAGAALLVLVALLGLRSRHKATYAGPSRRRHRQLAPWVYVLVTVAAAIGTSSVVLLRPDVHLARSTHFWLMWGMVALMTAAAALSLRIREPWARSVHPWLGLAAAALAITGVIFGIGLLP